MNKLKLFAEGFVVGLGKIMPGVSGSLMAICFGFYERLISCLSSFKTLRNDFSFFMTVLFGIAIAIVVGSNAIKFLFDRYFILTISTFVGMMIPGVFSLFKNVKGTDLTYKRCMISVFVFFLLILLNTVNMTGGSITEYRGIGNGISLFLCGILDAAATIIPGISGSALLMIVGYYEVIISALASPIENLLVLIPFLWGLCVGVVLISKLMSYLFQSHRAFSYMLIITLAAFSIIVLMTAIFKAISNPIELVYAFIFTAIGAIITSTLDKLLEKS